MKTTLIIASVIISLAGPSGWAANTPFKVRITEEQHNLAGQQLTDLLKLDTEKKDAGKEEAGEPATEIISNPLNDPFMPQIPKPPAPAAAVTPQGFPADAIPAPLTTPAKQPKPAVQKPNLTISGIIWNSDRPQAIINNQVVDVGTTVDSTTVLAINKTGIDVLYSGEKFNIPYN